MMGFLIGLGLALILVFIVMVWWGNQLTTKKRNRFLSHMTELASISERAYKAQVEALTPNGNRAVITAEGRAIARFLGASWVASAYSVGQSQGALLKLVNDKFGLSGDEPMHLARGVALISTANDIRDEVELERFKDMTQDHFVAMTDSLALLADGHDAVASVMAHPDTPVVLGNIWTDALQKSLPPSAVSSDLTVAERMWFIQQGVGAHIEWRRLLCKHL